ncbi:MAG TPA: anhydro-N-acetylmuramic acid kinase [Bacteroidales bacterium]|nr:anhydro-N-acetylmuramic acid kinase [Bacteroidales bacterium]
MKSVNAIGLMSGTSLDGLDLAWCRFVQRESGWSFKILAGETIGYSRIWEERLRLAPTLPGRELIRLHQDYGNYLGITTLNFIEKHNIPKDSIIASHGHTIFHVPAEGYTFQAGSGASIAAKTGMTVVCDFRTTDVALGGQGAPLVPIGDELLFPQFDFCLNLGGFANISFRQEGHRVAFDICPVNILLNRLVTEARVPNEMFMEGSHSERQFLAFDPEGSIAAKGSLNLELLKKLNGLDFYTLTGPRSLGLEWVESQVIPVVDSFKISLEDKLRTFCEHIAIQISSVILSEKGKENVLITGGGALNQFLISLIGSKIHPHTRAIIPDAEVVHFKEALVFAFLGVLRVHGLLNTISGVTGSSRDHSSGAVYLGNL